MSKVILVSSVGKGIKIAPGPDKLFDTEYVNYFHQKISSQSEQDESTLKSEYDLPDLSMMRIFLTHKKLIKISRGRYVITEKGEGYFLPGTRLYRDLFDFFSEEFNWLATTNLPDDLSFLQDIRHFLWYILHKKGREFVRQDQLFKIVKKAFPEHVNSFLKGKANRDKIQLTSVISYLCLMKYAYPMGFVQFKENPDDPSDLKFKTTPLFREVLQWKV